MCLDFSSLGIPPLEGRLKGLFEEFGEAPDEGVHAVGGRARGSVGAEVAHLVFEFGEGFFVEDAALGVEGGDGFSSAGFPSGCVDGGEWDRGVEQVDKVFDEVAALVDFGDDAVGVVLAVFLDDFLGPLVGVVLSAGVVEDVGFAGC